jgi:hypothetical protein
MTNYSIGHGHYRYCPANQREEQAEVLSAFLLGALARVMSELLQLTINGNTVYMLTIVFNVAI